MLMEKERDKQTHLFTKCKDEIKTFLKKYVKEQDIMDDQNFFATGLLNSMFAMQLVIFVEKKYDIKVENQDIDIKNFSSINSIAAFVERKMDTLI